MNARFQRFHTQDLYITATMAALTGLRIFCMIQPSKWHFEMYVQSTFYKP